MRRDIGGLVCGALAAALMLAVAGPAFADATAPKLKIFFSSASATLALPLYVAQLDPLVRNG